MWLINAFKAQQYYNRNAQSKNNTCSSRVCRTTFSAVHVLRVHDPAVQLFIAPLYAIPFIIMTN